MNKKLIYLIAVIAICVTACSSNSEDTQATPSQSNSLIVQGKEFANAHNECLANIYDAIVFSKTRVSNNKSFSKDDIIKAANKYIAKHNSKTRVNGNMSYITVENYTTTTEDIRNKMSDNETNYIDRILSDNVDNEQILNEIANDKKLTEDKKRAIICFATTYNASTEYWQQNIEKWQKISESTPTTRARASSHFKFNVREVATADAYWGYTGMLASGLNWIVGAGAAAAGSAFACLK